MDSFEQTRSSLLHRLQDLGNREAWEEFFELYWRMLFAVARRAGLNEADAEDVVMETVECVAKQIGKFEYRRGEGGGFKGWLKTIVRRRVVDHLRKRGVRPQGVADGEALAEVEGAVLQELEAVWEEEWRDRLVNIALAKVRRRVGMKQYQIFYCYVVQEWAVDQVRETLGVSADQVYTAKRRVGKVFEAALVELRQIEGEA